MPVYCKLKQGTTGNPHPAVSQKVEKAKLRRFTMELEPFNASGVEAGARKVRPLPPEAGEVKWQLSPEALSLLTAGVDMRGGARFRDWYER